MLGTHSGVVEDSIIVGREAVSMKLPIHTAQLS
jgi:hypothetical protein